MCTNAHVHTQGVGYSLIPIFMPLILPIWLDRPRHTDIADKTSWNADIVDSGTKNQRSILIPRF